MGQLMNAGAKLQLSSGHSGEGAADAASFYHNPNSPAGWDLTPEERAFAAEPAWMLMKNRIVGKTVSFFGGLATSMQQRTSGDPHLSEIRQTPPKISRGENFQGLPWVVLDYPRRFGKQDIFAVRTLFWWGKYFSVTLHLKGSYKARWWQTIRERSDELEAAGFHIGIAGNEWRHELEDDNYRPLKGMNAAEREAIAGAHDFLKLSAKCGLSHGDETGPLLLRLHDTVMGVLESR
ncbi:MAG: hypothetical protein Q8927_06100 [Bacteroidota bacterium]|nr:hypothetical protein [Bacteroidota bacterium]